MIKPIKISALNIVTDVMCSCDKCGWQGDIHFKNRGYNYDSEEGFMMEVGELDCPKCGEILIY